MPFGWAKKGPTPAQKHLGDVLFNEMLHVLSSFELNRIASLTYGDEVCDEIFEILETVQARPMEQTVLTVQKSLVITKHVLVYGSEKCVNSALALQRHVELLLEFNTVLWAQKLQGAAAVMYKLKGGGVDKGYPVREAAKEVWPLMTDVDKLRNLRNSSADPNSLVPVGNEKIAFLSDDVRHYLLKKRIQEQYACRTKSNLVKEEGGFGSGYASKDGKTVVGAAHGLEEMIKQAQRTNNRFSDEGNNDDYEMPDLTDTNPMARRSKIADAGANAGSNLGGADFLSGGGNPQQNAAPIGDLLDFSAGGSQPQAANAFGADLLGTGSVGTSDLLGVTAAATTSDLLGTSSLAPASDTIDIFASPAAMASQQPPQSNGLLDLGMPSAAAPTQGASQQSNGLLDFGMPSAAAPSSTASDAFGLSDQLSLMGLGDKQSDSIASPTTGTDLVLESAPKVEASPMQNIMSSSATSNSIMGGSVMSSNEDRFSALDALEVPASKNSASILSAKEAENRLLGHTPSFEAPAATTKPAESFEGIPNGGLDEPTATPHPTGSLGISGLATVGSSAIPATVTEPIPSIPDGMPPNLPTPPLSNPSASLNGLEMGSYPIATDDGGITVAPNMSSLNVSATYGDPNDGEDDGGFVMGGTMGAGLEPTAAAPAAPPPPPPPPPM